MQPSALVVTPLAGTASGTHWLSPASGAKRRLNVRKHGIDFADSAKIFRGVTFTAEDTRDDYGERRFLTLGLLGDQVVSVAHTEQGEEIRIISIRKATKHEARFYFSQITY